MGFRSAALALACALSAVLVVAAVASATTPAKKHVKKPAPAPKVKPMCVLGQSPVLQRALCTANPIITKDACQTYWTPIVQQLAPGLPLVGYDLNGAAFGNVSCFWKSGSTPQVFDIQAMSLDGSSDQSGKKLTAAQAWQYGIAMDNQTWNVSENETCPAGYKSMTPQLTTVEGYPAYTEDPCPDASGWSMVRVLVGGHATFAVSAGRPTFNVTSQQLIPLVEQVIARYKQFVPAT
ncbi:MAG: hypothetical protein JO186_09270 [Actinobacteria bacterium]|nr:hypothetical protein [Actinomycetota bacterium]